MGKYTVTSGQSLYDIALHIYGSIEGITDLLINNASLSLADVLQAGQQLVYTDDYLINADVVAYNRQNGIVPANGERNVYYKEPTYPRVAEFHLANSRTSAGVTISGEGVLEVDWGDNSTLQRITLGREAVAVYHSFDNSIATPRKVRFYGDFRISSIDLTGIAPLSFYFYSPVYAEIFSLKDCTVELDALPMLQGTYSMDLSGIKCKSLLPLSECRQLMSIDLTGANIPSEALDEYLISLVKQHYGRRSAKVILTDRPSGQYREPDRDDDLNYVIRTGMEAVWVILNEPAWNEAGEWSFTIDGESYTTPPLFESKS